MVGKTIIEQEAIAKELRTYFDMNVGPYQASIQTKHDYGTCVRHYDKFKELQQNEFTVQLAKRQRDAANQFDVAYSKLIFNLNAQLNEFIGLKQEHRKRYEIEAEKMRKDNKKPDEIPEYEPDKFLEKEFKAINKLLGEMVNERRRVIGLPFIDEETEAATLERMQAKTKEVEKKKK